MERRQDYTREFKAEAVKLVLGQGLSLAEAAERLPVPKGTLTNWVYAAKTGTVAAPGTRPVAGLEAEAARLRRELAEARHHKKSPRVLYQGRAQRRVPPQGTRS